MLLYWWTIGTHRDATTTNDWSSFIQNAGPNDPNEGEASLLYVSTGTDSTYTLETNVPINIAGGTNTVFHPSDLSASTDWTKSLKWFMTDANNLLGDTTDAKRFITIWDDVLQKASANGSIPHAILGTRNVVAHDTANMALMLNRFFDKASTEPIADAWVVEAGVIDAARKPLAALMHYDNKDDTLTTPTPDSSDKTMRYLYIESSQSKETIFTAINIPSKQTLQNEFRLASVNMHFIPSILLTVPYAVPEQINQGRIDRNSFKRIKTDYARGCIELDRGYASPSPDLSLILSDSNVESLARDVIQNQAGGLPNDSQVTDISNVMVGTFESGKLHQTYKEFSKGKTIRFSHIWKGRKVIVDSQEDYIQLHVDVKGVKSVDRVWHQIIGE